MTKLQSEAAEEQAALRLYQETFQSKKALLSRPMAFVKGGTLEHNRQMADDRTKGGLYLPTNARIDSKLIEKDLEHSKDDIKLQKKSNIVHEIRLREEARMAAEASQLQPDRPIKATRKVRVGN